jgi:hypothetical protein
MTDIVKRLRHPARYDIDLNEAADEIERLRQGYNLLLRTSTVEIERLREQLVLQVRPRDEVMPGAFIARVKRK